MTDNLDKTSGLVSEDEYECLFNPKTTEMERNEIRERVTDRLRKIILDFRVVYPTLRESDIESAFNPESNREMSGIRAATQDALALLIYGMLTNDDLLEMRLQDAIQNAAVSFGEQADVTLDIRRGPVPTLEQFIAQLTEEGISEKAITMFEYFLYETEVNQKQLIKAGKYLSINLSKEDLESADQMAPCVRKPQMVCTDVKISDYDTEESKGER